jgi:hypothetical protein
MEKGVEMTPFVFFVNYFIERILIAVTVKKDFVIAKNAQGSQAQCTALIPLPPRRRETTLFRKFIK